jgi:hypothetical protein
MQKEAYEQLMSTNRNRDHLGIKDKVREILQLPCEERTEEDIKIMNEYFEHKPCFE